MKFIYEYRTRDNVPHQGTISAPSKELAYETLKAKGIRPGKVWEAPGLLNKLFGKGKRWMAIGVLMLSLAVAIGVSFSVVRRAEDVIRESEDAALYAERGQIYGPQVVLADMEADDFASVFSSDLNRFLACYAIPGRPVEARKIGFPKAFRPSELKGAVAVKDGDLEEVKRLKRMVNGVRREFREYLSDGGNVAGYLQRLDIRQRAEASIYERTRRELLREQDQEVWKRMNSELRAKGLPMVDPPSPD